MAGYRINLGLRRPRACGEQSTLGGTCRPRSGPSPHARGAAPTTAGDRRPGGPSPHARGAAPLGPLPIRDHGTIPARAGSRTHSLTIRTTKRDHPRMRGEQSISGTPSRVTWGPSPHARGADGLSLLQLAQFGTIPASAGSRAWRTARGICWRDHPRTRGEQLGARGVPVVPWGHPRTSGEQSTVKGCLLFLLGPSPHARGAAPLTPEGRPDMGTIPARAGSSTASSPVPRALRGHPRERREQRACRASWRGATPARAGSRSTASFRTGRCRDHPRECGEQSGDGVTICHCPGPSPRARGAAEPLPRDHGGRGAIPARAGSRRACGPR